ncbi:MAG TPA: archease [Thermoanaerobaculia bacterium]|nr:archease [Thermoanaerobaculia bacterium]
MHELIAHTADVRFRIASETLEGLFAEAVAALTEFMQPAFIDDVVSASFELDAIDTTSLLVDFLSEVLTRCHVRHEAYESVVFASLDALSLRASLRGRKARAFGEDVKAVTYHEAEVVQREGGWSTMLVLDI